MSLIRCHILFSACLLSPLAAAPDLKPLLEEYCIDCHDGDVTRGGLNLDAIMTDALDAHPEIWEKVILRLQSRQMPPLVPVLMTAKPQPTVEASPPIRSWGTRR